LAGVKKWVKESMKEMAFLGMALLCLNGCVSLSPQEKKVVEEIPVIEFEAAPGSIGARLEAGDAFLKKGYYKEALEEFKLVLKLDHRNQAAQRGAELSRRKIKAERERVAQSLLHLKDAGADLYQRQEYVQAAQIWKEAIQLYQTQKDPASQRELTFNPEEIQVHLDRMIQLLLEKGIFLYRQGKLEAAIAAWQDVLSIDPQQHAALDYMNKARTKLETLEHLSSTSASMPVPDKSSPLLQAQPK
jgi:tetratricopeptide (TPR) repeat protein